MNTKLYRFSFVAFVTLLSMGCGNAGDLFDHADASGTVTMDGEPLTEGIVYFVPTNGTTGPKSFAKVVNGKFSVTGEYAPVVGNHRIEIKSTDDGGLADDDEEAIARWVAEGRKRAHRVIVPPIYNQRSILTADVTADGPNEFKFELSSKRRR